MRKFAKPSGILAAVGVCSIVPRLVSAALIESAPRAGAGWRPIVFSSQAEDTIVTVVDVRCVAAGTGAAPAVPPSFVLAPRDGCTATLPPDSPAESIPIHRVIGSIYKLGDHDICAASESEDIVCTVKAEPEP